MKEDQKSIAKYNLSKSTKITYAIFGIALIVASAFALLRITRGEVDYCEGVMKDANSVSYSNNSVPDGYASATAFVAEVKDCADLLSDHYGG